MRARRAFTLASNLLHCVTFLGLSLSMAVLSTSCTKATVIGTACTADSDCNVKGQVCAPGFNAGPKICTRICTGQTGATGCPAGYDCFPTDPAKGSTCNKALYELDANGNPLLIGVSCNLDNDVCLRLGSTNPGPHCRKIEDFSTSPPQPAAQDPSAYCTGVCTTDADCPLDFSCTTDYDKLKKCLRRTLCSECTVDANCSKDFPLCIPTKDGASRYCSKSCASTGDCGGVQNTAFACDAAVDLSGNTIAACVHRYGACVGDGNICDPCRSKADCAKSNSSCYNNGTTGESFCTKACNTDAECASGAGKIVSACDNTSDQESFGGCDGDPSHLYPGLRSCWLPQ
jgi:hypothetical protein